MSRHARPLYLVQRARYERAVVAAAIASGILGFLLGVLIP